MAIPDLPFQITKFEQELLQAKKLVLVDFWAPWCGPCQAIAPILEGIAQEYKDKLKIYKINIDENQKVAAKYHVLSIPTLLFFKGAKVISQLVGTRSAQEIKKTIDSLL